MGGNSNVEQSRALPFDSTQTIRAVTMRELRDANQQKWFAVQLAISDRPVDLETLPRFEVFATYRLYAVQGRLGANPCYALRLGFFTEQEPARQICADLKAFYRSASVVQVSAAEQVRFEKAPGREAPLPVAATTSADVVEISSARRNVTAAPTPAPQPTITTPKPKAAAQPARTAGVAPGHKKPKSLSQELMEEARQIQRAKSGRHSPKQNASWLSRLFGRSNT
jgi:hypothetical protein